jgi:hypothetical protein
MASNDTLNVIIENVNNADEQLKKIFSENHKLKALRIIIPENHIGKDVYAINNHLINYSNPLIYLEKEINTIPNNISELKSLEYLNISSLGLKELPENIIFLKNLKILDLSRNRLDIKRELWKLEKLTNLQVIKLYGIQLSEVVVNELPKLGLKKVLYKEEDFTKEDREEYMKIVKKNLKTNIRVKLRDSYEWISSYFPAPEEFIDDEEPNYIEIRDIIENKIQNLHNGNFKEWISFVNYLNKKFEHQVIDCSYNQAPYLGVIIQIDSTVEKTINTKKLLVINLSLVEKVFTIYYSLNTDFKTLNRMGVTVKKNFWHGLKYANKQESDLFNEVLDILNRDFKEYTFVQHNELIDFKVMDRIPYNAVFEKDKIYCLFDFLFSGAIPKPNEILE